MKCPKCSHECAISDLECPKCGIIFKNYELYLAKKKSERSKEKSSIDGQIQRGDLRKTGSTIFRPGIVFGAGIALAIFGLTLAGYVFLGPKGKTASTPTTTKIAEPINHQGRPSGQGETRTIVDHSGESEGMPTQDRHDYESPSAGIDLQQHSDENRLARNAIEKASCATVTVETPIAQGSGFFITNTGYILTNRHVIKGAETVPLEMMKKSERNKALLVSAQNRKEQIEKELVVEEKSLSELKDDLDNIINSLRETKESAEKTTSRFMYNNFVREFEEHKREYNRKLSIFNRMQENFTRNQRQLDALTSQIDNFQKKENQFEELVSKIFYKPAFKIILMDGTEDRVYKVAECERLDLALLKLDGQETPCLKIGDPMKVALGQKVFAIGSPLGLRDSVTSGVFSAHRGNLLQTSALINHGNSGGPLITEDGQVIGINTAKVIEKGVEGISFAIPIDVALREFNSYLK